MREDDFIGAIIAEPDDDLLRLAFADWLEENDQPERAQFIRLQIEAARLPVWSAVRARPEEQADAIRAGQGSAPWRARRCRTWWPSTCAGRVPPRRPATCSARASATRRGSTILVQ